MKLLQFYVDDLIKRAITEDINYIDSTTDLLIDETIFRRHILYQRLTAFLRESMLQCVFSHYLTTLSR